MNSSFVTLLVRHRVFEFRGTEVHEVMSPRVEAHY